MTVFREELLIPINMNTQKNKILEDFQETSSKSKHVEQDDGPKKKEVLLHLIKK